MFQADLWPSSSQADVNVRDSDGDSCLLQAVAGGEERPPPKTCVWGGGGRGREGGREGGKEGVKVCVCEREVGDTVEEGGTAWRREYVKVAAIDRVLRARQRVRVSGWKGLGFRV